MKPTVVLILEVIGNYFLNKAQAINIRYMQKAYDKAKAQGLI
jgi:hypothetical protein